MLSTPSLGLVLVTNDGSYKKLPRVPIANRRTMECARFQAFLKQASPELSATQQTLTAYAFFCTDPLASVQEILEAFADRATIEQDFHDVKEVWGSGQQQVRNIWTNLAVYNLNLWMHTLVEMWAWDRLGEELVDRSDSPWDDAERRPSHANRRKALRRLVLDNELQAVTTTWSLPQKIIHLAENLVALAA